MQPGKQFLIPEQHRHPVMDTDHRIIGCGGQDYEPFLSLERIPEAGQVEFTPPRQVELIFGFSLIPLIKARGRYHTPPLQQRPAEHRFIESRFTPGVDDDPLAFEPWELSLIHI